MIIRIAEALFWIGRYMERVDNHARLIDVHYHMRHELTDPDREGDYIWGKLAAILGEEYPVKGRQKGSHEHSVLYDLTFERKNLNSIMSCIHHARENTRSVRDRVPGELWDAMNSFYLWFKEQDMNKLLLQTPHLFYHHVREGVTLFFGAADSSMLRGNEWNFIQTGRYLERMENVIRLLQLLYKNGANHELSVHQKNGYERMMIMLKSVSGYEAFRKFHGDAVQFDKIVEFLMLNPGFPRSVTFSYAGLEAGLMAIRHSDTGFEEPSDLALHHLERLKANLDRWCQEDIGYSPVNLFGEILGAINQLGSAIAHTFFHEASVMAQG